MNTELIAAVLIAVLGSSTLSVALTHWLHRRQMVADTESVTVQAALALEQRAVERWNSGNKALDEAQRALNIARRELSSQADYIDELHRILSRAGIKLPEWRPAGNSYSRRMNDCPPESEALAAVNQAAQNIDAVARGNRVL